MILFNLISTNPTENKANTLLQDLHHIQEVLLIDYEANNSDTMSNQRQDSG